MKIESPTPNQHRQAWDLIPWVVNGSADEAQRRLVEQHAAGCEDCRDELAFHRQLQAGMQTRPVPHSAEPALARMLARIDADAQPMPMLSTTARWTPKRWLAAAVVVQALGLTAVSAMLWERTRAAEYQTLSRPDAMQAAPATPPTVRLVPAPTLRLAELQALLARAELRIVDASGDGAILGLAPQPGASAPIDSLLLRLRAEPGVLLAEPVR